MKTLVMCLILMSSVIIPIACGNSNNTPAMPIGGTSSTSTGTPTKTNTPGGPVSTATPLPAGANTPTFTPTFAVNTPTYENTYPTSASPNGMVISVSGGVTVMTLAEYEKTGGGVYGIESFNLLSNGMTVGAVPSGTDYLFYGAPTPGSTPAWAPTTYTLSGPQGFINPGGNAGYAAVLDNNASGGATLYSGSSSASGMSNGWSVLGYQYEPLVTNGYGGIAFNHPKALTGDSLGNIYVTDTGNGLVEQFWGYTAYNTIGNNELFQTHKTPGNGGITFINSTVPAQPTTFISTSFKSPYGITCDTSNNIWVTDIGYSPSVVEKYSFSGGVSILAAWPTVAGCVATGIAIAPPGSPNAGDVYVADAGNSVVEIYNSAGTLLSVLSDPHSAYEGGLPFAPSCIGFNPSSSTYDLWVADTNNDYVISFK